MRDDESIMLQLHENCVAMMILWCWLLYDRWSIYDWRFLWRFYNELAALQFTIDSNKNTNYNNSVIFEKYFGDNTSVDQVKNNVLTIGQTVL